MLHKKGRLSLTETADLIDRFLQGGTAPYEWDDFESQQGSTPELEDIRQRAVAIWRNHPPRQGFSEWSSPSGIEALRALTNEIRSNAPKGTT